MKLTISILLLICCFFCFNMMGQTNLSFQLINVGTSANSGTGDTLRSGGQKINSNFESLSNWLWGGDFAGTFTGYGFNVTNINGTNIVGTLTNNTTGTASQASGLTGNALTQVTNIANSQLESSYTNTANSVMISNLISDQITAGSPGILDINLGTGRVYSGGNTLGGSGYSGALSSDLDVFGYNLNNVASINADTANLGNATITNNLTVSNLTVSNNMTLAGTLTVSNMDASQFSITNPANSLAVAMVCTNITGTNYVGWQVQGTNWWIPLN